MNKNVLILSVFTVILCSLLGCDPGVIFEESLKIEEAKWKRESKARFEFEIEDTTAKYEIHLNFRHGGDYPYRNVFLFTETTSPSERFQKDTAQMILADQKGRWLGKGIGDIFDYQFGFKQGNLFPEKGTYVFEIEQGMRLATLPNITDIGISIRKVDQ